MNQFQGKVDIIMEYLHTKKEVATSTSIETPVENVAQPVLNQPSSIPGPSGHANVYPWGMPQFFFLDC